jgi:hypothetical protein
MMLLGLMKERDAQMTSGVEIIRQDRCSVCLYIMPSV